MFCYFTSNKQEINNLSLFFSHRHTVKHKYDATQKNSSRVGQWWILTGYNLSFSKGKAARHQGNLNVPYQNCTLSPERNKIENNKIWKMTHCGLWMTVFLNIKCKKKTFNQANIHPNGQFVWPKTFMGIFKKKKKKASFTRHVIPNPYDIQSL